jgi:heptosyltransferase-1
LHHTEVKILLVKTSSLGDIVHNLPVVQDIRTQVRNATVDWVVERGFAHIPALHPCLRRAIPCQVRSWRKSWYTAQTRREWSLFLRDLRAEPYDAIIDTQGLLKSALISRAAIGTRYGLDWRSSREPLRVFYDRTFSVPRQLHAVDRNRRLCGFALGYQPTGAPNYGIDSVPSAAQWLPPWPYLVFLHATSNSSKLWPEPNWIDLGTRLASRGYGSVLPWGNSVERARAARLGERIPFSCVAPQLEIKELAAILSGAIAAVGVDTGLTHLAAALGKPVVGIFGASDPKATGIFAATPAVNLGAPSRFPGVEDVFDAVMLLCQQVATVEVRSP